MRALALLVLAASCHREAPPDCAALTRTPLRQLDAHSFARACGPLLPPACRPPTSGVPDTTTLPTLEAACRGVTGGSGDVFEAALPASISAEDRRVVAMALRSELLPPAVTVHLSATDVEIDGKHMPAADAAALIHARGDRAIVWGGFDVPETRDALLHAMHALGDAEVVMCARNGANCR